MEFSVCVVDCTWPAVKDLNGCCNVYTQLKLNQFELFLCKLLSDTNVIHFCMLIFNGEQRDIMVYFFCVWCSRSDQHHRSLQKAGGGHDHVI